MRVTPEAKMDVGVTETARLGLLPRVYDNAGQIAYLLGKLGSNPHLYVLMCPPVLRA